MTEISQIVLFSIGLLVGFLMYARARQREANFAERISLTYPDPPPLGCGEPIHLEPGWRYVPLDAQGRTLTDGVLFRDISYSTAQRLRQWWAENWKGGEG